MLITNSTLTKCYFIYRIYYLSAEKLIKSNQIDA